MFSNIRWALLATRKVIIAIDRGTNCFQIHEPPTDAERALRSDKKRNRHCCGSMSLSALSNETASIDMAARWVSAGTRPPLNKHWWVHNCSWIKGIIDIGEHVNGAHQRSMSRRCRRCHADSVSGVGVMRWKTKHKDKKRMFFIKRALPHTDTHTHCVSRW